MNNYSKITYPICIFLFVVTVLSCNTKKKYYAVDTLNTIEKPYSGDYIRSQSTLNTFIEPQEAISIDSFIVVLSSQNSNFINVISCISDSLIASFGEHGHAINEFVDFPHNIYAKMNHKSGEHLLYIPDDNERITRVVNLEKSIRKGVCCVDSTFKNNVSGMGEKEYTRIDEKRSFCCYGVSYEDPRDNIFISPKWCESNEGLNWEYHPYPEIISVSFPSMAFAAYATKNRFSPDMRFFVSMMKFIDRISLCDLKKKIVTGITTNETYGFDQFELLKTEDEAAEKLLLYNIDVSTTNEMFFVLKTHLSYRELAEMEETGLYKYPTYLHVYNWQGTLIKKFRLECGIRAICYNETVGALYCLKHTGEMVKYFIPKTILQ